MNGSWLLRGCMKVVDFALEFTIGFKHKNLAIIRASNDAIIRSPDMRKEILS